MFWLHAISANQGLDRNLSRFRLTIQKHDCCEGQHCQSSYVIYDISNVYMEINNVYTTSTICKPGLYQLSKALTVQLSNQLSQEYRHTTVLVCVQDCEISTIDSVWFEPCMWQGSRMSAAEMKRSLCLKSNRRNASKPEQNLSNLHLFIWTCLQITRIGLQESKGKLPQLLQASAQSLGLDCLPKRNPWERSWCLLLTIQVSIIKTALVNSEFPSADFDVISVIQKPCFFCKCKNGKILGLDTKQVWALADELTRVQVSQLLVLPANAKHWLLRCCKSIHVNMAQVFHITITDSFQYKSSILSKNDKWKNWCMSLEYSDPADKQHRKTDKNRPSPECHASSSGSTVRSRLSPVIFFHLQFINSWSGGCCSILQSQLVWQHRSVYPSLSRFAEDVTMQGLQWRHLQSARPYHSLLWQKHHPQSHIITNTTEQSEKLSCIFCRSSYEGSFERRAVVFRLPQFGGLWCKRYSFGVKGEGCKRLPV